MLLERIQTRAWNRSRNPRAHRARSQCLASDAQVRGVPVSKLNKVNEELERLCNEGIRKPVTQPTDWLSNILVKEKPNGKLRICIAPGQTINRAIRRPKYTIPTIEEKLPLPTNAKVFTIADVTQAFHSIELDEESSLLTTFQGPSDR